MTTSKSNTNSGAATSCAVIGDAMAPTIVPSIEERRKQATSDLGSLNRVSHRLALVDTSLKLQTVLDKLLPRLLQRIGDNNHIKSTVDDPQLKSILSKIHLKLIEMLSHVSKRVRDDQRCRLSNAKGILDLLLTSSADENDSNLSTNTLGTLSRKAKDCDSFSLNLSLAFLTLAVPRCTTTELEGLLPGLLILHACYEERVRTIDHIITSSSSAVEVSAKKQWHQVSHLLLGTLERIIAQEEEEENSIKNSTATKQTSNNSNNNYSNNDNKHKRIKTFDNNERGKEVSSSVSGIEQAQSLLLQPQQEGSEGSTHQILSICDATYGLFLDALLYRTQVGNVPPQGLGSANWERLKSGHSLIQKDWASEMALSGRLMTFKTRLLKWIAPNRRRCLFLGSINNDNKNEKDGNSSPLLLLGRSRTVALLAVGSGDHSTDVSQTAKQYLKQYFDSHRESGSFGNANVLCKELLSLCVGGINSELVLSSSTTAFVSNNNSTTDDTNDHNYSNMRLGTFCLLKGDISFRRRQVSETNFTELIVIASQALEEVDDKDTYSIGKLALLASDKMLSKLSNALGVSLSRGRSYIVAAELMNALIVRLEKNNQKDAKCFNLDARALSIAVSILTPTASSKVTSLSSSQISEASVAVRDSIYGTVSLLCRSSFAQEMTLCLMAGGNIEISVLSTDLLQLLFRCVGNEIDKLRTRATASLDALLLACRHVVERMIELKKEQEKLLVASNPWDRSSTSIINDSLPLVKVPPIDIANQLGKSVLPILWTASNNFQPRQSRIAAAHWASDLIDGCLDVTDATHILSFLAGDTDATASAIAEEGLGLRKPKKVSVADFDALIQVLVPKEGYTMTKKLRPTFWEFSSKGKAVALKCLLRSYLFDFHGGEQGLNSFMFILTKCLTMKGKITSSLEEVCSEALSVSIGTSATARSLIQSLSLPLGLSELRDMIISSNSSKTKRFLADAFGNFLMDASVIGSHWIDIVTNALSISFQILKTDPLKPSNEVHGAALLGGTCIRLVLQHSTLVSPDTYNIASQVFKRFGIGLTNLDDMIGNIFCDAIFLSCSGDDEFKFDINDGLNIALASVLKQLASALNRFGDGDRTNAPRILKLIEPTGSSISKSRSSSSSLSEYSLCVDALFKLLGSSAFRKDEEIGLTIGEALATIAQADCALSSTDVKDWPLDMNETFAKNSSPAVQVVFTLIRTAKSTNNHKRKACGSALAAVVARATRINDEAKLRSCLQSHLAEVQDCFLFLLRDAKSSQLSRESCCLGLAACDKLVVESESEELKSRLLRSFGTTNHGGSVMQETAEQAERRRREDGANVATNHETSNVVDIGGAAGVSEASLGAFREMASAAVASGRPDILYSMLILSVSHSIWFATEKRRDMYAPAALGKNFSNEEIKDTLRPFLGKLLPRILRACHEHNFSPNKQTREQMETLWRGVTGGGEEARRAISDNLCSTIDALVLETSSKYWRARVGACGALSQICLGRSWEDIGGGGPILDENWDLVLSKTSSESTTGGIRLLRLWRAAIRALDDVRITVRESGESLGRCVRSLTIYLCNPYVDSDRGSINSINIKERERDAVYASATVLRWLLRNGLKQQCPEASGICISTLIGIIDTAKTTDILEALLSDIIFALLMAMSNLEPAAFSYLAVREEEGSNRYENLSSLRIQASQSSPLAKALRNCVDLVPKSRSKKYQEAVVPAIELAIRKSSGMATRTAAAECVITLCATCPSIFQHHASSCSLLRCFFEAVYQERGGRAAQDKMNGAFGALCSLIPGNTIRPLANSAAERYKEAHGNNDDPTVRKASAMILRSIAVKSSQFADPGNSDVWCKKVLPISYIGMRDPEKRVASLWQETWEEGGATVDLGSSKDDTGNTIEEKLLLNLTKECVKALNDHNWSRRVTGAITLASLAEKGILAPLPHHSKNIHSKVEQDRAKKRANASCLALSSLTRLVARNKIWSGKDEVVHSLVQVVKVWISVVANGEEKPLLGDSLAPITFLSESNNDLFMNDYFFETEKENRIAESEEQYDRAPENDMCSITLLGICRLLLLKSFPDKSASLSVTNEEVLPYRSNCLKHFELLLESLPDTKESSHFRRCIFEAIAPKLWDVFRYHKNDESSNIIGDKESPLIVSRSIDCFTSSCWSYLQLQHNNEQLFSFVCASKLLQTYIFHVDYTKQSAWTIREAAAKSASKLAQCADFETMNRRQAVSTFVDIAASAIRDSRFWKVRLSGLHILKSIVLRVGTEVETAQKKQLILELILPYKESIQGLSKKCLNDPEAKVTALSIEISGLIQRCLR